MRRPLTTAPFRTRNAPPPPPDRARVSVAALALALCLLPSSAAGQVGDLPETPEAAVTALFDAMRAADSARVRKLVEPGAELARPVDTEHGTALRRVPVEQFIAAVGSAEPGQFDERVRNLDIRRDGALATAWMEYAFHLDGELHHCGVNAFQLYRTGSGWKIFGLADTSRAEGCSQEWEGDAG